MRLLCVSNYRSSTGEWREGDVLDVSDSIGAFLLVDSPGSFVAEDAPKERPPVPNVNRQQTGGRRR